MKGRKRRQLGGILSKWGDGADCPMHTVHWTVVRLATGSSGGIFHSRDVESLEFTI